MMQSVTRKSIAIKPSTVKRIMKSGEGSAIVNAGTACIRSRLKSGSRVIKNSL